MSSWIKNAIMMFGLLLIGANVCGQPYGNEWIDENQTYFKFNVGEDGFYRITSEELVAAGFPVNSVPSTRIRLYRRGEEQAIRVNSSEGLLQSLDFYGRRNDGLEDQTLYSTATNQLHPNYSIYTDSSAYFLTFSLNNTAGLRMESYTEANTQGLPAEVSFNKLEERFFSEEYSAGRRYSGGSILLSSYDRGEGWIARPVKTGVNLDVNLILSNGDRSSGNPSLNITLAGANNNPHNASILVGPDESNLRELSAFIFNGYDFRVVPIDISWNDVASDGSLVIRMIPTAENDRISISTLTVTYKKSFELDGVSDETISLNVSSGGKSFIRVTNPAPNSEVLDITDENNPIVIGVNQSESSFIGIVRNWRHWS